MAGLQDVQVVIANVHHQFQPRTQKKTFKDPEKSLTLRGESRIHPLHADTVLGKTAESNGFMQDRRGDSKEIRFGGSLKTE